MPRFEPMTAEKEASLLHLCYAAIPNPGYPGFYMRPFTRRAPKLGIFCFCSPRFLKKKIRDFRFVMFPGNLFIGLISEKNRNRRLNR